MTEAVQEQKEKKVQSQAQSQLTYDPNNPDPHWRRRQFAVPGGEQPKRDDGRRKFDVSVDGYRIRNEADFDRVDMSRAERRWKHRKAKLEKRAESSRRACLGVSW